MRQLMSISPPKWDARERQQPAARSILEAGSRGSRGARVWLRSGPAGRGVVPSGDDRVRGRGVRGGVREAGGGGGSASAEEAVEGARCGSGKRKKEECAKGRWTCA
jgi:hypothetical protein